MADRDGIFAGDDPFAIVRAWHAEASQTELNDPDAASLATVDVNGLPNVRIVLVREIDDDGFVFFTNYNSAKGNELLSSKKGALGFHWKSLRRQIRARGKVELLDAERSDAYFLSRPVESRFGAWASNQSQPLRDRRELEQSLERSRQDHGPNPSRPPHWGGFRLLPEEMEFWADGPFRLHNRFRWRRKSQETAWEIDRLNP